MKHAAALGLAALLAAATASADAGRPHKVGVTQVQFTDAARQRPLPTRIWYPAADTANETPQAYNHAFKGTAAPDAAFGGDPAPLIVLSHGDKGNNTNQVWLAEALAAHGNIVAAVDHWKNTTDDNEPEETVRVWQRPQDMSFVISALLADPAWKARIDPARIGATGHSSGGYTALALAGAVYAPLRMQAYCASAEAGTDCTFARGVAFERIDFSPSGRSYRDPRVRAVFAMAPALGPGMQPDSLKAIRVPVQIVAAANDEILPFPQHAARYAREIPGARLATLEGGGHFVFMPECTFVAAVFTYFHRFDICGHRHDEVERADVHARVAKAAVTFFESAFAGP